MIYEISTNNDLDISKPIIAAYPQGYRFIEILRVLSNRLNKRHFFAPIPWQILWAILKCLELSGTRVAFKSDNLVSLMNSNLQPDFEPTTKTNTVFRPLY